jgi:hypothetical protein
VSEPWWAAWLREQRVAGFPAFEGAEGGLRLPVPDRLVTEAIAHRLSPPVPVRELDLRAEPGNQFVVRLKPALLPPLALRFQIDRQPELPHSPVLVLRLARQGLAALAGPLVRVLPALPAGIRMDGDRILVDLATLLRRHGAADVLDYLSELEIATDAGRFVVSVRAAVRRRDSRAR